MFSGGRGKVHWGQMGLCSNQPRYVLNYQHSTYIKLFKNSSKQDFLEGLLKSIPQIKVNQGCRIMHRLLILLIS